jgi:hypothetical protein
LSLTNFLNTISKIIPIDPLAGRPDAIAKLDPDKIYVENVRSALGVSSTQAKLICETAVRRRVFDRYVEVTCPDGAVAASAPTEAELPERVRCWEEHEGLHESVEYLTTVLPKTTFYRLHK